MYSQTFNTIAANSVGQVYETNNKSVSNYSLSIPPAKCDENLALDHVISENKVSRKRGSRKLVDMNSVSDMWDP